MITEANTLGTVTVTLTVRNTAGKTASTTFNVTIQDIEAPIAIAKNISVVLDENGKATITPEDIDNGSSDTCGIESMALDITEFNCSHAGNNTVLLTVTDKGGNKTTAQAIVTIGIPINLPVTISTTAATNIASFTATLGGSISNDCVTNISERGIVWNTNPNPTIANYRVKMEDGPGLFSGTVDNLFPNKTTYYRAYAIVNNAIIYGDEQSFKTIASPLSDFSWTLSDDTVGAENVTYNFSFTTALDLGMNTQILYAIQQYETPGWNTAGVLLENVTVTIDGVERTVSSIWTPGYLISLQLVDPLVPAGSKVSISITGINNSGTIRSYPWQWIQTGTSNGCEIERVINPNPIVIIKIK